jgi:hypothetical protein
MKNDKNYIRNNKGEKMQKATIGLYTIIILVGISISSCVSGQLFGPTRTPSPTITPTYSPTYTLTLTITNTNTPTATNSKSPTPTINNSQFMYNSLSVIRESINAINNRDKEKFVSMWDSYKYFNVASDAYDYYDVIGIRITKIYRSNL